MTHTGKFNYTRILSVLVIAEALAFSLPMPAQAETSAPASGSLESQTRKNAADSWVEKAFPNLLHYSRPEKGGHFAAWEQPEALTRDLRAALKSLR